MAGEFLKDVHRICSDSEDEDVGQLREYLLWGRGGTLLRVLYTIGIQVGGTKFTVAASR